MTSEQSRIPLTELLETITSELHEAHEKAMARGQPVMRFQECEIEFAIEAETKAGGGLRVWVLSLGGSVKRSDSNTIKIKYISLDPAIVAAVHGQLGTRPRPQRQTPKER